jgi:hypothetical protein
MMYNIYTFLYANQYTYIASRGAQIKSTYLPIVSSWATLVFFLKKKSFGTACIKLSTGGGRANKRQERFPAKGGLALPAFLPAPLARLDVTMYALNLPTLLSLSLSLSL